jgi:hypothetical protein
MTLLDRPRIELPIVRCDTLPESTRYADEGCAPDGHGPGFPSCLECPLAECKYDAFETLAKRITERNAQVFEQWKRGVTIGELVRAHKVSTRTIHRIIQSGGAPSKIGEGLL